MLHRCSMSPTFTMKHPGGGTEGGVRGSRGPFGRERCGRGCRTKDKHKEDCGSDVAGGKCPASLVPCAILEHREMGKGQQRRNNRGRDRVQRFDARCLGSRGGGNRPIADADGREGNQRRGSDGCLVATNSPLLKSRKKKTQLGNVRRANPGRPTTWLREHVGPAALTLGLVGVRADLQPWGGGRLLDRWPAFSIVKLRGVSGNQSM